MMPVEFLFLALLFVVLGMMARKQGSNSDYMRTLRIWTAVQGVLFVVFTVLVYTMERGFMTPFGGLYLLSLGLACGVVIRMRGTIEVAAG